MSLALATLIFEWRRYSAAVIALAFSGLLLLAITGIVFGSGASATATIDRSAADLIVLDAHFESMLNTGGAPKRIKPAPYLNPGALSVDEMNGMGVDPSERADDRGWRWWFPSMRPHCSSASGCWSSSSSLARRPPRADPFRPEPGSRRKPGPGPVPIASGTSRVPALDA